MEQFARLKKAAEPLREILKEMGYGNVALVQQDRIDIYRSEIGMPVNEIPETVQVDVINNCNHTNIIDEFKRIMKKSRTTLKEASIKSGVSINTVAGWRCAGIQPTLSNFNKVIEAMGYELQIVQKK